MTEAEVGVPWSQAEECRQPPEVGKGKEWTTPQSLQKDGASADTFIEPCEAHSSCLTCKTVR